MAAIDPASHFAAPNEERHPGVEVRVGPAEELLWEDGTFDAALAQLVIAFMRDPARSPSTRMSGPRARTGDLLPVRQAP